MHTHPHSHSSARSGPSGMAGNNAAPSGGAARRPLARLRPKALKPVTYSLMHLCVAIAVAYALTRDWRIALGVGVIEPMVQTVAYMIHDKAWSLGCRRNP